LRSGARETSDTAPSTATVCATGDTCRGTHGRGWRQDREGSGCPSAISPTKQKRNTDTPTCTARPIQFSTPEALRRDKDPTTQNPVAAGDNRLVEWNEASETITPQATNTRGTMQDGGEKSYSENLDPTSGYSPPPIECDTHRDHGTHQDRGKPGHSYILTARDYQCDTDLRNN